MFGMPLCLYMCVASLARLLLVECMCTRQCGGVAEVSDGCMVLYTCKIKDGINLSWEKNCTSNFAGCTVRQDK